MRDRRILIGVLAVLAGALAVGRAQQSGTGSGTGLGKRPMTFADLQRMKRVSDPQISPSGRWVMFSVTDVDLEKNTKVNHLWVVSMGGGRERQVTFWKEGETGGRFSPDGKQVLFVSADGGTSTQIYLASWNDAQGTLGTPRRLTNVSTEVDGGIWSPDSQRILFTSRVYPECSEGSSWLEEENCDKRLDAAAAANPVKAQVWDRLLYRHWNNYVGPKRSHVLVVSATDGNMVRDLTPRQDIGDAEAPPFSLGGPPGYAWAPDSKEIAYVTNLDLVPAASTNNDVFTLRLDTPGAKPLKASMGLGSDDAPSYSPDGKLLGYRSQARAGYESDRFRLMVMDRETMKSRELLPKYDRWVDEFIWGPDSKAVYIASGDAGRTAVVRFQFEGDAEDPFKPISTDGEFSDLQLSFDGKSLVATRMSVDQPAEINVIAPGLTEEAPVDSGSPEEVKHAGEIAKFSIVGTLPVGGWSPRRQLTHLNDAVLRLLELPEQESFRFAGAGGTPVEGFLIRPPRFDETATYPVKFLIHGGPQGAWGDAWSYRWNAELMAASGYVVVMVNPRGSTGYGQAFVDGVNGDWGGKAYVDLMKGMDYAEKQYAFIDKTRECALGASYGGFMANWILTHTDRFACIVTHDGMFNPQSAYGDTEELWFNEWEFREPAVTAAAKARAARPAADPPPAQPWNYFGKPVAEDPFRKWSPMLSIKNAKTPTLVIHSQRDYRLDVSEGLQLFTALQRLNVPSRMLYFPDEGHWVLKPQNSKLWYETVGEWCDLWTKTNAYGQGYGSVAAPTAPSKRPRSATPDTRMGVSRPGEMDEAAPPVNRETIPPEKTPAPQVEEPKAPPVTKPRKKAKPGAKTPAPQASVSEAPSAGAPDTALPPAAALSESGAALSESSAALPSESAPALPSASAAAPQSGSAAASPAAGVFSKPAPVGPSPVPVVREAPAVETPAAAVKGETSGDPGASFAIAITAPNDEVQVGSAAPVVIALRNTTDHQILFAHRPGMNNPEFSFRIAVLNAQGHPVEETAYGREARQRQQTENRTVDYLQPGMTSVQMANVSKLVELKRPGKYKVRVSRKDSATGVVVTSNEVTLNVVP